MPKQPLHHRATLTALAIALVAVPVPAWAQGLPPDLDQYVTRVMRSFSVPGLSVAIVKDGKTLLAKG
ncbi:MAG TPA: hypothetical protein VHH32_00485, partial [Gemmatimonadales bacterium]|nr:hypothetical protein [Gemmatimonadales bacterium]